MEEVGGKRGRNRETGAGGGKHVLRDGFLGIMKRGSGNKFKICDYTIKPCFIVLIYFVDIWCDNMD